MNEHDDEFARRAGALLRHSADDLDAATAARLNRARQAALAGHPARRRAGAWLVPSLATAALATLVVGLWLGRNPADPVPAVSPPVESPAELELLLAGEDLEMLEDLEFYAWLDGELDPAG